MHDERIDSMIIDRINSIDLIAQQLPVIIIIHSIADFSVVYMSPQGLELLGVTLDEIQQMKSDYRKRFFNIEDWDDYVPKIKKLLTENDMTKSITYLQQVKLAGNEKWEWYMSASQIFMQNEAGDPIMTITTATCIGDMKYLSLKAERLLEENNFLRNNYQKFSTLGKREKEILKLVALGKSSPDIGEQLFIASATVDAHRKNIKKKLSISSHYDFTQYARAFDLI
jgi:DNA-binding CsgD family transcriptional regulator